MYKTLCIAVVLLAAFAFMSGSRSADASPTNPPSPLIVARGKLLNQTAPISATIFTPVEDGLFRLSVYATTTTADPSSTSSWVYGFSWTDATGIEQNAGGLLGANNAILRQFYDGNFNATGYTFYEGGISRAFQANKGTPVMHSVGLSGPPDNSAYSLYYVVERLE